jgi:NarL family two-component system sensor histidine kinase LiaS
LRRLFLGRWTSLRARMTVAYVAVTVGPVLTFSLLGALAAVVYTLVVPAPDALSSDLVSAMRRQAQTYAMVAAYQVQGAALDPRTSFVPGQAHSIAVANPDALSQVVSAPYIATGSRDTSSATLALLVAPDGRVLASSYPARFPSGVALTALAPVPAHAIRQALAGRASTGTAPSSAVTLGYAAEPIWSADHRPVGAIYLQVPGSSRESILARLVSVLTGIIPLLLVVTPIGVFFGWIVTRDLVGRVQRLVAATAQFAGGDYTQRVASDQPDEIGQLERQFNQMAEQMAENLARRQQLAEQNARLEERSRISRELHDAVSQDLFSLRLLADGMHEAARAGASTADLRPKIAQLEQTAGGMTRAMRALLLEMRPLELEDLGLADALRTLAETYGTRLGITVTAEVQPVALDVPAEHALLRIAQEALANAARHSSAKQIALRLTADDATVTLTISDNGEGFDPRDGAGGQGLGLRIMRERVAELGGTLDLHAALGAGTRLVVTLPREHADD